VAIKIYVVYNLFLDILYVGDCAIRVGNTIP
jgi:hypothetical protein